MPSHKLQKITIDEMDIMGYSVAGEETVVAMPQLDVCFDIGKAPDQVIPINNVLLTHGHMDHAAGIAYYLSHRNFNGQEPGTVLAPADSIPHIKNILDAWGNLDGNAIPANLVGVKPGEEYQVKPNLYVRVFPVKHSFGAVGYSIIEKRKKLKEEYLQLNSRQIVELKKQGVEIDYQIEMPIVTYFGDTQYVDYSQLEYIKNSKILIIECTFYEDEHIERAKAGRHMHINEFASLVEAMNNEQVIVSHVTHRTALRDAKKMLKAVMSEDTYKKITFLMDAKNRSR